MINSKIIQALEPLNIPIYWMNYSGDDSEYIIFQTNNQDDVRYYDDDGYYGRTFNFRYIKNL